MSFYDMIMSVSMNSTHRPPLLRPILPVLLAALLISAARAATTITLQPGGAGSSNADAFVATGPSNNLVANNYGAAGALAVSAAGLPKGVFDSLLRFDVSTVKSTFDGAYGMGGWNIDSIALQLTTSNANNAIFNTNATGSFNVKWISNDAWTEGTGNPNTPTLDGVSWNDLAALTASAQLQDTFAIASIADGVTASYTLSTPTAGFLSDLTAGTGSTSLFLDAADSSVSAVFNSRNFGTSTRRPALIVTASAVPEPGRALLLLAGAGFAALRRRRTSGLHRSNS